MEHERIAGENRASASGNWSSGGRRSRSLVNTFMDLSCFDSSFKVLSTDLTLSRKETVIEVVKWYRGFVSGVLPQQVVRPKS